MRPAAFLQRGARPTYTPAQFRGLVYDRRCSADLLHRTAVRTVLPLLRAENQLALEGLGPDQDPAARGGAHARGELPRRDGVSFA